MLLPAGEVCRVLGIPHRTLSNWVRSKIITPVYTGVGKGNSHMFQVVPDVLAVSLGRGLRRNGITLEAAGNAMEYVMNLTEAQLDRALAQGRDFLVMVGSEVAEHLFTEDEIAKSRPLRLAREAGTPIIQLDLGRLYRNLMSEIAKQETQQAVEA
jgi:DNA-binding transcriptional MerR regulator